jgi:putative FmdB family regulatory protein
LPTYSYKCTECGTAFDIQQAFTDNSLTVCPNCGGKLRKVFTAIGVTFNGSGFYRNDSRPSEKSGSSSGGKGSDSKGSDSKGSDSKGSDSKGSDSKPSESKSSDSKSSESKSGDSKPAGKAPTAPAASPTKTAG